MGLTSAPIVMFDSTEIFQIPVGPAAVAGYVNGMFQTAPLLAARFPRAHLLTIAVSADADADALDVETGDARPADVPAWYRRQRERGVARPCLYASVSVMHDELIPVLRAAGIDRAAVRLWSAHYAGRHICGPGASTCGELSINADGTQHTDRAFNRDLDQSLLAADFFAAPGTAPVPVPAPAPPALPSVPAWQEAMMQALPVLSEGADDKSLPHEYVKRVQVIASGIFGVSPALTPDGVFGAATKTGVEQVQQRAGITADGVVGPLTWSVLYTGAA